MPAARPIAPRPRRRPVGDLLAVLNQEFVDVTDERTGEKRRQPKKHFVLVPKNRDVYGQAHYENLGYELTPLTHDGPRIAGISRPQKGAAPQSQQEYRGCLLMQIDYDLYLDIQRYGENGNGGTEAMEEINRMISDPSNVEHQGRYVQERNESKPSEFVLEQ